MTANLNPIQRKQTALAPRPAPQALIMSQQSSKSASQQVITQQVFAFVLTEMS